MISIHWPRPSASCRTGNAVLPAYLRLWVVFLLIVPTLPATAQDPIISLDKLSVPASGQQSALVTVTAFGRYAISAASEQGVGLQLIDRMSGPGPVAGGSGERDGRLDLWIGAPTASSPMQQRTARVR